MARTVAESQMPQPTWAAEIRNYERHKRHVVDEGLLRRPQVRVTAGKVKTAERVFDPLVQRFRDDGVELQQRTLEEKERVAHLNRAQDIQILREQPFDIIRHESKLDTLVPGADPARLGGDPRHCVGNPNNSHPDTTLDYNLISNLPFDVHHWAQPGRRPHAQTRNPKQRSVPAHTVKDFNIVTNQYVYNHEDKSNRDRRVELLEATRKDAVCNRFNPVTQQFNDPHNEECARTCDDAHSVELALRADSQLPLSFKGRETAFYDMVTHQKHDKQMLRVHDEGAANRKKRYGNRYIMEHNWHAQDIKGDHITNVRKLNRIPPERFDEETRRGYDIISNCTYGTGPKSQTLYAAWPQQRSTPWEQATSSSRPQNNAMACTVPARFPQGQDGSRSEPGRSRRSVSAPGSSGKSLYAGRAG